MIRRPLVPCALVLLSLPAMAARPLSYEETLELAARQSPAVRTATLLAEQAGADVTTARGSFDPNLTLGGGWNRDLSRQRFGNFPDPFNLTSDGWNLDLDVSGTLPTGTTASFSAGMSASTVIVDVEGDDSILAALFGDGVQENYRPTFRLTLSQELLKGVRLRFNLQNVRRAQSSVTLAELEFQRATQEAVASAARAYWNWVYLAKTAELAVQSVAIATENLRVGTLKVERGQASTLERTRLEAAMVQAQSAALEAEVAAASAGDQLLLLLGDTPGQALQPASDPGEVPFQALDAASAVTAALAQSPEVLSARQRLEDARTALRDARHATLPSLTANVTGAFQGFDDQSLGGAFVLYETMFPSIGLSGQLRVPLGGRVAAGQSRRAASEVERQAQALTQTEDRVRADVEQQVRQLLNAVRKVELADANLRLAQETVEAEEALYAAGRTLLQQVLEARTGLDRAASEAVKARTDYRTAEVELQRLQGRL